MDSIPQILQNQVLIGPSVQDVQMVNRNITVELLQLRDNCGISLVEMIHRQESGRQLNPSWVWFVLLSFKSVAGDISALAHWLR